MLSTKHAQIKPFYYVKCFPCPAGAAQDNEDKPPRSVLRYRVKNAVKKCTKTIKKTSKKLAQAKNLRYLCIKQKR